MSGLTENIVVGLVLAGAAAVLVRQARGYWSGKRKCCSRGCGDQPEAGVKGPVFLPVEDLEARAKDKKERKS